MRKAFVLMTAVVMSVVMVVPAGAATSEKSNAQNFDTEVVEPGFGTLKRNADNVEIDVHLRDLTAGNAVTVWAVIFNTPEFCEDGAGSPGPCDGDDVFPGGPANAAVIWSGIGGVVNRGGNFNGLSTIGEGDDGAPGQILFGNLADAEGAEIHFIVQDHGEASDDAATLLLQTTTFQGGCNTTCVDIQFIAFK
jgi:hypothetical protein